MRLLTSDFYKHLLLNSTDLLSVIDETGLYKYVGSSVESILGYTPDELIGKSVFNYIHPDDCAIVTDLLEKSTPNSVVTSPPFRFMSKNNGWRWLESTVTNRLQDQAILGFITNARDITETIAERSNKDLHQAYYKSLFEEHPDAVFSLDLQGYFKSVNRPFCQMLGYPESVMLLTHFTELTHKEDISLLHTRFLKAAEGKSQAIEIKAIDSSKNIKIVHVTLLPVYLNGAVIGVQGIAKDITENIQAHNLTKEHSEQLRKILESVTEPFFALDSEWHYTFVNQAYCNFLNRTTQELIGVSIWDINPHLLCSSFYKKCFEVAQTGKTWHLEEAYSLNKEITISYSIFPFVGGIAIYFVDVTAKNAVKLEMEKLSLVANKTINGVIIMDANGVIEWVNDGFTRLTGYTKEEALGCMPSKLLQGKDSDPETVKRIRQKYKEQEYFTEEVLNYTRNGEPCWVNIDITPIKDVNGNLQKYIAIQTDITERKKTEADLIKLADDMYKQNLDQQQFTYIVSHNLRAPVANAMGLVYLLRKIKASTAQFNTVLDKLDISVSQLDGVIKDINKILSIRDTDRMLPREWVNLLDITKEVLSPFQEKLTANNANVWLEIDSNVEMFSNRAYLYSIIQNLVSNAIKYRSPERVLELVIKVEKDARGFVYIVSDNGLGMDMQLVKNQLFKLYKRFHPNTHGKGIGLFLVKTQVETIGGKITVESEPGVGTSFKLLLGAKHV